MTAAQLSVLDHAPTRAAASAERSLPAALGAGCSAPVGALAEVAARTGAGPVVPLWGLIAATNGSSVIRAHATGAIGDGDAIGRGQARTLLLGGGAALLEHRSRYRLAGTGDGSPPGRG